MDDNQLADGAYEDRAKKLLRDVAIVLAIFLVCSAVIVAWALW